MKQFLVAGATALLLGACTIAQSLQPPAIAARAIPADFHFFGLPKSLSANITAGGSGIVITRIEVRINRDRDASRFTDATPLVFTAAAPLPQSGVVTINLPPTLIFRRAQLVTATWYLDYMLSTGGTDTATVKDTVSRRMGCTAADVTTFLTSLQTIVTNPAQFPQTLSTVADFELLRQARYVPSHLFQSFVGQGVAFARPFEAFTGVNFTPTEPLLLLYAPPAATLAAAAAEPLIPDLPYTLIGFAYAFHYDPSGPPSFDCMPREAWFVHEAGWHPASGGFFPQTFTEDNLGDSDPDFPPLIANPGDLRFGAPWHPRLWDVHLFIRPGGVPLLAACNPAAGVAPPPDAFAASLLATCAPGSPQFPAVGATFPPGGFFVRALPP
jgi:hypothetical protein